MKYVTAKKISKIDKLAQTRYLIPSLILMENAGRAVAEEILKQLKKGPSRKVALFCGKGNNGGDGMVVARHLACEGIKADVFLLGKSRDIKKPDPLTNLNMIRKMKLKIIESFDQKKFNYGLIVDAIFGTGFRGELPAHIACLVEFLNRTGLPIFSIDVPSGLDATTGKAANACIKATRTVTFGLPKQGLIKSAGPRRSGRVVVRNISYPKTLL